MTGSVHHVFINASNLERSREFYAWLMPQLGYPAQWQFDASSCGWLGAAGSFWIKQTAPEFSRDTFHKDRVGLCEIAFRAETREQVDELYRQLLHRGAMVLDAPREYPYVPGYYAVFFADPDGIKLELVHLPS